MFKKMFLKNVGIFLAIASLLLIISGCSTDDTSSKLTNQYKSDVKYWADEEGIGVKFQGDTVCLYVDKSVKYWSQSEKQALADKYWKHIYGMAVEDGNDNYVRCSIYTPDYTEIASVGLDGSVKVK